MAAVKKTIRNHPTGLASPASGKEPLQVRIPVSVKRAFKSAAALKGVEPNELFVEVWDHYQRTQLETPPVRKTR